MGAKNRVFHTLSLGGLKIENPRMSLVPYSSGYFQADMQRVTGSLITSEKEDTNVPEVIIGMNVLRKLHLYIAPRERKMYVAEASAP